MIPRIYVDAPLSEGASRALDLGQAHYLRGVLRLAEGDALRVFNERDGEYAARLVAAGKKDASFVLGARLRTIEVEPDLWLVFAAVKRAALETIVQKAVELGVVRLLPVLTARTHRERVNDERLKAIAIEAAEQCGRLSVPPIAPAQTLDILLRDWPETRSLVFCDEAGDDPELLWGGSNGRARPMLEALQDSPGGAAGILIGAEGGFAPGERSLLRARGYVRPVTLGPRILRADTAAIAALTLWQAAHGDLKRT